MDVAGDAACEPEVRGESRGRVIAHERVVDPIERGVQLGIGGARADVAQHRAAIDHARAHRVMRGDRDRTHRTARADRDA